MPKDLRTLLQPAKNSGEGGANAPLAQRRSLVSPGEPRVFRVRAGYVCGLCGKLHERLDNAFDCLGRCTIELRLRTPVGRLLSGQTGHFACTACGKGYANTDDAEDCFERCLERMKPSAQFEQALRRVQVRYVQRLQAHGVRSLKRIDPFSEHTKMLHTLTQEQIAMGRRIAQLEHQEAPTTSATKESALEAATSAANDAVVTASGQSGAVNSFFSATDAQPVQSVQGEFDSDFGRANESELNSVLAKTLEGELNTDHAQTLEGELNSDRAQVIDGEFNTDHAQTLEGELNADMAQMLDGELNADMAQMLDAGLTSDHDQAVAGQLDRDFSRPVDGALEPDFAQPVRGDLHSTAAPAKSDDSETVDANDLMRANALSIREKIAASIKGQTVKSSLPQHTGKPQQSAPPRESSEPKLSDIPLLDSEVHTSSALAMLATTKPEATHDSNSKGHKAHIAWTKPAENASDFDTSLGGRDIASAFSEASEFAQVADQPETNIWAADVLALLQTSPTDEDIQTSNTNHKEPKSKKIEVATDLLDSIKSDDDDSSAIAVYLRRPDMKSYRRNNAKYTCSACNRDFFTREQVDACFYSHPEEGSEEARILIERARKNSTKSAA